MRAGNLDRPIVIQSGTFTTSDLGQEVVTWATFWTGFARWEPMTANDRFRASGIHAVKAGKFTIRYKSGVLSTMRVLFDSEYYKILGVRELPRREGTELTVELIA